MGWDGGRMLEPEQGTEGIAQGKYVGWSLSPARRASTLGEGPGKESEPEEGVHAWGQPGIGLQGLRALRRESTEEEGPA